MNKGGWTAKDYTVSLILFSAVIALAYLMVGALAVDYGSPEIVNENFQEHYNKLEENTNTAADMLSATSSSGGLSLIGTFEILLSSTFSIINLVLGSFAVVGSQVAHIGSDFGIPTQVTAILLTVFLSIITVSIVFIVINAVNKTDRL